MVPGYKHLASVSGDEEQYTSAPRPKASIESTPMMAWGNPPLDRPRGGIRILSQDAQS